MAGHPLLSHQPLKIIFQLTYIGTIAVRLPVWIIVALVPWFRPHPKWTPKQTLIARLTYAVTDMRSRIGLTEPLSLEQGEEGSRFQTIEPFPSERYQGPLASGTRPAAVGGTWFPRAFDADAAPKNIIVLYFHGGAYVKGDGRIDFCGFSGKNWVERSGADAVFSVQYRLSGYSGLNPFPAALQDALTSYLFLLDRLRIPAHQIVVSGDSAGGNLAIALLRYIEEFGSEFRTPVPRCAVLLSPWVAPFDYDPSGNPNRGTDFLPMSFLKWGANTYAGHLPDAAANPYITPLSKLFTTPVPIFANAGSAEIFLGAIARWAEEMRQVRNNDVELNLEDAACHDTFLLGEVLGFEDSAREVADKIGAFIRKF
ncbi:alpha/beta hydrolase fold-3 domain-containing protein [Xylariaceae sp. FL0662B]|nr:alpha/beta hydrolase fold-3 domain-containing protein [Xylariaceae sp. FL0662B]